jgi:hypothetical protein
LRNIGVACASTRPAAIAERVLAEIWKDSRDPSGVGFRRWGDSPADLLPEVLSGEVAPAVTAMLLQLGPAAFQSSPWSLERVLEEVAARAGDPECVRNLVDFLRRYEEFGSSWPSISDSCYQALATVSQRLNVHVDSKPGLSQRREKFGRGSPGAHRAI